MSHSRAVSVALSPLLIFGIVGMLLVGPSVPRASAAGTGIVSFLSVDSGSTGSSSSATSFTITANSTSAADEGVDRIVVVPIVNHKHDNGGDDAPTVTSVTATGLTFNSVDISPADAGDSFAITNGDVRISLFYASMPDPGGAFPLGPFTITVTDSGIGRGLGTAYIVTRVDTSTFGSSIQAIGNSGNPQFENVTTGGPASGMILNVFGFDAVQFATLPAGQPTCVDGSSLGCAVAASEVGVTSIFATTTVAPPQGVRNVTYGSYLIQNPNVSQLVGFDVGSAGQWVQLRLRLQPSAALSVGYESGKADAYRARSGSAEGTMVQWRTGAESENLGFNVYREEADGVRVRINRGLVAGSALIAKDQLLAGYSYSFWDPKGTESSVYWIEDVDLRQTKRMNGPIHPVAKVGAAPVRTESPALQGLGAPEAASHLYMGGVSAITASGAGSSAAKGKTRTASAGTSTSSLGELPAMKISVRDAGWYRVTQSELTGAGLDTANLDPRTLKLYGDGVEIPIRVSGEADGRFDAADAIEFFGSGVDETTTSTRVYWLTSGNGAGKRIRVSNAGASQSTAPSFLSTVELKQRFIYFAKLANGDKENFFGDVVAGTVDQVLELPNVDTAGASGIVEIALQGVTEGTHRVTASLNGQPIGQLVYSGLQAKSVKLTVAGSLVREGANVVTLDAIGGDYDVSLVDAVRITYSHASRADQSELLLTTPATLRTGVKVSGFNNSQVRVVEIADGRATDEYLGTVTNDGSGYSVAVQPAGRTARRLYAFTPDRVKSPVSIERNVPSTWASSTNAANIVIVTHSSLASAAAELRQMREAQGYRVAVVDVGDLYDEFTFGKHSPEAIRNFTARAMSAWQTPPQYMVLLGDSSYDPRDYYGVGMSDYVPTKLVDTSEFEAASDDWLADTNNDDVADVAIGRLPARTAGEASGMISKIIGYEQNGLPNSTAVFIADVPDTGDFVSSVAQVRQQLPSSYSSQQIDRLALGDVAARAQTLAALDGGPGIVAYAGHGSVTVWRGNLLVGSDASALTNSGSLSLYTLSTCLNGYFMDPLSESLGESLLKSSGGAVAVWTSSGLTLLSGQQEMQVEFMRQLFNGQNLSFGQAAARAKAVAPRDVRRSWVLLGDPVTRLK